jgi:beta-glucosidase
MLVHKTAYILAGAALLASSAGIAQNSSMAARDSGAVANPKNWPKAQSPLAITDPQTEKRIAALVARMTIEQKVGQVIQGDISAITPEDLKRYPLGSILAGGNSGPYGNERSSASDWDRLVQEFRAVSSQPQANGIAIPIIFGVDAVHGHNNIPGATVFPHNIGLGAAHDVGLIQRIGAATAVEIAASGIEWTFAPTLAVPQDYRWGRSYEGYSASPQQVAAYANAMTTGLQGKLQKGQMLAADRVAATAKHFLADGGTTGGKDTGDAQMSERELVRSHAQGYPVAINAGALTLMASFSSWNGVKHHGNKSLLTDVLKGRMGFQGFVVGDWNGHGHVSGCSVTSCPAAINAGLDMYMAPDSWKGLFDSLVVQVRAGEVPMARLDDAVSRILRVKAKLGLLDNGRKSAGNYDIIGSSKHLELAREAAAKSLVLLKNEGSVLPIRPGAKVLVAGDGADDIGKQSGGWTITWQGLGLTRDDFPNGQSIWQGIQGAVKEAGGLATLSADGSFSEKPDVAIVVFGENPYAEFQGDIPTLDYQPSGAVDLALLKKLKQAGIPVVSVFLSGRPMFTNPEINASDAFVAAWLPGSQGQGVADVLIAGKNGKPARGFTGKLSFAWPADARSPITKPLYRAGYGLRYGQRKGKRIAITPLSEDPKINIETAVNATDYFVKGRARAPWSMSVNDAGGARSAEASLAASPLSHVTARSVDVKAQEDGKALIWAGSGSIAIAGPPANMTSYAAVPHALRIEWRIDSAPTSPVTLAFGERTVDISKAIGAAQIGAFSGISVPLRCFVEAGADMTRVGTALQISAGKGFAVTLLSATLEPAIGEQACPAVAS